MTLPRLKLIVVRSLDPARTVSFYEFLGIHFQQEQHGSGSVHWAVDLDGLVLEVYPAKAEKEVDQMTRLGFEVEEIAAILSRLRSFGTKTLTELRPSQWGLRAVVQDPDGRSVELVQSV